MTRHEYKISYSFLPSDELLLDGWEVISFTAVEAMDGFAFLYRREAEEK